MDSSMKFNHLGYNLTASIKTKFLQILQFQILFARFDLNNFTMLNFFINFDSRFF
jgi:hypothetical protein